MKKLILLLGIVINVCDLSFGDPTEEQIKKAGILLDLVSSLIGQGQSKKQVTEFFKEQLGKDPASYPKLEDTFLYEDTTRSFQEHFNSYFKWQEKAVETVKELRKEVLERKTNREIVELCFMERILTNGLLDKTTALFRYVDRDTNLSTEFQILSDLAVFVTNNAISDFSTLAKCAVQHPEETERWNICVALIEENPEFFLFLSIRTNDKAFFDNVLNKNPKLDARDENGLTPLMIAAVQEESYFAEQLIKRGAAINMKWRSGLMALDFAVYYNRESIVQLLLEHNASINVYIYQETKKIIIMMLLKYGMNIGDIPIERLDEDMMALYVDTCQKRFPGAFKGSTDKKMKTLALLFLYRDHKIDLPNGHYKKLLIWDGWPEEEELTSTCSTEMGETPKPEETPAPEGSRNFPKKKQLDPTVLEEMNRILCASYGTSTTETQKRNLKVAGAGARKAQRGSPTTSPVDKSTSGIQEASFLKIFNLTPKARSKRLDKGQTVQWSNILQSCIDALKPFGIIVEHTDAKNHPLIAIREVKHPALKEFYLHHKKSFKLSEVKPGNSPCTDHYNEPLSALIQYMCEIVENDLGKGKDISPLVNLMWKFVDPRPENCNLNLDIIAQNYPKVFDILQQFL